MIRYKEDHFDGVWCLPVDPEKPHGPLYMEELQNKKSRRKASYYTTLPDDGKVMELINIKANLVTGACEGEVGEDEWAKAKVLWAKKCDSWDAYIAENPDLQK